MDLQPTRGEARLFVGALWGFWAASGLIDPDVAATGVLLLAVIPLGFTVYLVYARVASRAAGVPMRVLLGFRRPPRGQRISTSLLWVWIVTPYWWKPVLRATGWPAPFVVVVLAATLVAGLVARLGT